MYSSPVAVRKYTEARLPSVSLALLTQVAPPSVVFRTTPFDRTAATRWSGSHSGHR